MKRCIVGMVPVLLLLAGCSDKPGPEWKKSGTDVSRKIDHYYLKSSVIPFDKDAIKVRTKLLAADGGKKTVAKASHVENAFSIETEGVIYCKDSAFMVLTKEYFDKQGISLKIEKDGGNMASVVQIRPGQALYPMISELCAQAAAAPPPAAGKQDKGAPVGGKPVNAPATDKK